MRLRVKYQLLGDHPTEVRSLWLHTARKSNTAFLCPPCVAFWEPRVGLCVILGAGLDGSSLALSSSAHLIFLPCEGKPHSFNEGHPIHKMGGNSPELQKADLEPCSQSSHVEQ